MKAAAAAAALAAATPSAGAPDCAYGPASGTAAAGAPPAAARCTHTLSQRLSKKLAGVTMLVIGGLSLVVWLQVGMLIKQRNAEELVRRSDLVASLLALESRAGGEAAVLARLRADAPMRAGSRLEVWRADGTLLHADAPSAALAASTAVRTQAFVVDAPSLPGGRLEARWSVDYSRDAAMGRRWGWILIATTLCAGALAALGASWHVRRALRPVRDLAAQTQAISPQRLDQRLTLHDPAQELVPWVDQFNALMDRLERAYQQLEGFNADVAHELRTPLAALIGHTELALSRPRSTEALRDTLTGNLEELQRLAALVNDMLFLAQADRGASARRGAAASLAALAREVVEFHDAPLEDAGLAVRIEGDAAVPVDEPLVKRALSNLLSNATRFAERGSTVVVRIEPRAGGRAVALEVVNAGPPIAPAHLPRIFDRFFRADTAREAGTGHHGLGLAIVSAIARMHQGRAHAHCAAGRTCVGFTLGVPGA